MYWHGVFDITVSVFFLVPSLIMLFQDHICNSEVITLHLELVLFLVSTYKTGTKSLFEQTTLRTLSTGFVSPTGTYHYIVYLIFSISLQFSVAVWLVFRQHKYLVRLRIRLLYKTEHGKHLPCGNFSGLFPCVAMQ